MTVVLGVIQNLAENREKLLENRKIRERGAHVFSGHLTSVLKFELELGSDVIISIVYLLLAVFARFPFGAFCRRMPGDSVFSISRISDIF